jgi:CTP synthase (UTP-ammonia lyase)
MSGPLQIGILGDFNPQYHTHPATNAAIQHAARKLKMAVEPHWVPTASLEGVKREDLLQIFDGLLASPGSPYKSFQGMLNGIKFARKHDWPFVGT